MSDNIQKQFNEIGVNVAKIVSGNVFKDTINDFTATNHFIDISASNRIDASFVVTNAITTDLVTASILNITAECHVKGQDAFESYYVSEVGSNNGKQAYCYRKQAGRITTNDNIICTGESVTRLLFDNTEPLIGLTGGVTCSANEFFSKYYYSDNNLFYTTDTNKTSPISTSKYSKDTHTEGGMVICLDISLGRNLYMNGNLFVGSSTFTALELEEILKNVGGGTTFNTDSMSVSGNVDITGGGNLNITTGTIYLTTGSVYASAFYTSSDYRIKTKVHTMTGSSFTVDNLRPVTYTLKASNEQHMGFIAHEVQKHFPSAVNGPKDGTEMQSVNYIELVPILVKEIQELKKEVNLLKNQMLGLINI